MAAPGDVQELVSAPGDVQELVLAPGDVQELMAAPGDVQELVSAPWADVMVVVQDCGEPDNDLNWSSRGCSHRLPSLPPPPPPPVSTATHGKHLVNIELQYTDVTADSVRKLCAGCSSLEAVKSECFDETRLRVLLRHLPDAA